MLFRSILPILDAGYFISPSGNKIVACLKTNVFSPCFLDKTGNVLAVSPDSDRSQCGTNDHSPGWSIDESMLFWHMSSFNADFKFNTKRLSLPKEYKLCSIKHTYALNDLFYVSFGTCCVDQKCQRPAKETKKFICVSNKDMNLLGLVFIDTSGLSDEIIRIEIDRRSQIIYLRTNDVVVSGSIELSGDEL